MAQTAVPEDGPSTDELRDAFSAWERDVVKVLAKSSRKDPAELAGDAWRTLIHTTPDGLEVDPLYTPLDELPEQPAPGEFPYVRGGRRRGLPDSGWHVVERVETGDSADGTDDASVTAAHDVLLTALGAGASALWIDTTASRVPALLDGVYLELAPVLADAGRHTPEVVRALRAEAERAAQAGELTGERADVRLFAACAPDTDALAGLDGCSRADALALAGEAASADDTVRALLADGLSVHERGATDAQELGIALAAAVGYVRALVDSGLSTADAVAQVWFRLAATPDQFATIAKMRAGRGLWARVAEVLGVPDAGDAPQHAVTSLAASTRRDPYVNMLRSTVAAFAAGVGGAEYVSVREFDATLPGGLAGTSRSFARRMARNTQLLLLEESHLGHVVDPAGGSWYVESRTAELSEAAWSYFQEIEALGGIAGAREKIDADLAEARASRTAAVASRTHPLTGLSEFPSLAEAALPAGQRAPERYSYGDAFEALRDRSDAFLESTGRRPTVALAGLGAAAERSARNTFVVNLLASGGVDVVDLGTESAGDYAAALADFASSEVGRAQSATVAVLCGSDKRYGTEGAEAVAALRDAGAAAVLVAGSAKAFGGPEGPSRADDYLAQGIDVVAAMASVAAQLGVK